MTSLRADVFVADSIPVTSNEELPFGIRPVWSPISATLLSGEKDAVLVDSLLTRSQGAQLVDWIRSLGKRLTHIYITHAHGDHFFGLSEVLRVFPEAVPLATAKSVLRMKPLIESGGGKYAKLFPGAISETLVLPKPLQGDSLELEGHVLRVLEVGESDTMDTTALHVPSIDLIVAGDIVYNDVHQFLGEANTTKKREGWLGSLEKLERLEPATVVAGHKRRGAVDGAANIAATREYILSFEEAVAHSSSAEELFQTMRAKYPNRVNPHALWLSALSNRPREEEQS